MKVQSNIIIFLLMTCSLTFAQGFEKILLLDIINNIDKYQNKTITLNLRFKYLDKTFSKIVFYDRKNYDIIFDTLMLQKKKNFQREALNLREGMEYIVKFTVKEAVKETGFITGDLIGFQPFILLKLLEGKEY